MIINNIYNKLYAFCKNERKYLLFAFIVGLIGHMYKIVNYLPNWDSMDDMHTSIKRVIPSGRWFSGTSSIILSSFYDIQWVEGLIYITTLSISIVLILELFNIMSNKIRCIAIILYMLFPTVASTFCYHSYVVSYGISYLMTIYSVYLCVNKHKKWYHYVMATLCVTLSCGIYQIYVTVGAICFMYYIIFQLYNNANIQRLKKQISCYIITTIIGLGLYYVIMKLSLIVFNTEIGSYQGGDSVGGFSFSRILNVFPYILNNAKDFYFGRDSISIYTIINVIIFILSAFIWIYCLLINNKNCLSIIKKIVILLFLLFSFLTIYVFAFVSNKVEYHMVMLGGHYYFYFGTLALLDNIKIYNKKLLNRYVKPVYLLFVFILCFYHFNNNNVAYKQMEMSYQRTSFQISEILQDIDKISVDGNMNKVMLVGYFSDYYKDVYAVPEITGAGTGNFIFSSYQFCQFANYYYNRNYIPADRNLEDRITATDECNSMGIYPNGDYIKVIDDIIVIRLK